MQEAYLYCYDWSSYKTKNNDAIQDHLIMWCLDTDSQVVILNIKKAYLEAIIPLTTRANKDTAALIHDYIKSYYNKYDWEIKELQSCSFVKRAPQYYYNEGEPFLTFLVPSSAVAYDLEAKIKEGFDIASPPTYFKLKEENVIISKPDIITQLTTRRNIPTQGYIKVTNLREVPMTNKISKYENVKEYYVNEEDLHPTTFFKQLYPLCAAYDTEWDSTDGRSFPSYEILGDTLGMISYTTWTYKKLKETRKDYIIVWGDVEPIDNIDIICVSSEEAMYEEFKKLILSTNPLMITGYNNDSFDMLQLVNRAYFMDFDWGSLGMQKDVQATTIELYESMNGRFRRGKILRMVGRITCDMYKYYMENAKRRSYKLDDVGKDEVGINKVNIHHRFIFVALKDGKSLLTRKLIDPEERKKELNPYLKLLQKHDIPVDYTSRVSPLLRLLTKYGMMDAIIVAYLFEKNNMWDNLSEMSQASGVTTLKLVSVGRMKRTYSLLYNAGQKKRPKIVMMTRERPKIAMKGGDVAVPIPGKYEYLFTFDFMALYPSIMKAFNIGYTTLLPPGLQNIPVEELGKYYKKVRSYDDLQVVRCEQDGEVFTYRYVHETVMISECADVVTDLLDRRTAAKEQIKQAEKENNRDKALLSDIRQLALKITANSAYGYLGAPGTNALPEASISITALGRMLIAFVRECITEFGGECIYGDTDSVMVQKKGCGSYTEARQWAKETITAINDRLSRIDTDKEGRLYVREKQRGRPKPLILQIEKVARSIIIEKKNYVMAIYDYDAKTKLDDGSLIPTVREDAIAVAVERDGRVVMEKEAGDFQRNKDGSMKYYKRGVVSEKRDKALVHCNMYDSVVDAIERNISADETCTLIWEWVRNIMAPVPTNLKFPLPFDYVLETPSSSQFSISGRLGKQYKDGSTAFLYHLVSRLAQEGTPLEIGDRFEFFITQNDMIKEASHRLIIDREYNDYLDKLKAIENEESNEDVKSIKIDRGYYITNRIMNTVDFTYNIAYMKELENKTHCELMDEHLKKCIGKLYCEYGMYIVKILTKDDNPIAAIMTYADDKIAKKFKTLYNKPTRCNTAISSTPTKDAYQYYMLRSKMVEEVEELMSQEEVEIDISEWMAEEDERQYKIITRNYLESKERMERS